ncbi:MAG: DUF4013 domain-containing protein [Thermoflexales bacterium]|nr:DUF4013 domain-containing protein [Thermoflexales bacterium]
MDFGKSFSYVFDDQDWLKKVLIGGVVTLVPILNFAAIGYALEVTRRVIKGTGATPLPEWDDLGGKLVKGLVVVVIAMVYFLPLILLSCVIGIPASFVGDSEDLAGIVALVSSCFGCLALIYSLFAGMLLPAAIGIYADKDEVGAAFRFGDVFSLVQKNIGTYLVVLLMSAIVAPIIGSLGAIACGIGAIFTGFYAQLIIGHLTGQAYNQASSNIGLI